MTTEEAETSAASSSLPDVSEVVVNQSDRYANKLLMDLVLFNVHRMAKTEQQQSDEQVNKAIIEEASKRIVFIMMNGLNMSLPPQDERVPAPFLPGSGRFFAQDATTVLSQQEAIQHVNGLLEVALREHETPADADADPDAPTTSTSTVTQEPPPSSDTSVIKPTALDVKLYTRDTTEPHIKNHKGNRRFVLIVEGALALESLTLDAPSSSRLAMVHSILDQIATPPGKAPLKGTPNTNPSTKPPRLFMEGTELSRHQATEFLVLYLFDKLVEQTMLSSQAALAVPILPSGEFSLPEDLNKPGDVPIDKPHDCDVLFGRGGMTNNHPGNRRFRDIISLHRPDYVRAIKIEKPNVARRIVAAIRGGNPPGRFLKKDSKDHKWYDVGNRHATEKTSQALREKTLAEKNGKVTTEGDVRKRLLEQALYEARITRMRLSKEGSNLPAAYYDPTSGVALPQLGQPNYLPILPAESPALTVMAPNNNSAPTKEKPPQVEPDIQVMDSDTAEEMKKIQEQKEELAKLASQNEEEDPPMDNRGVLDKDGNILVTENDILCGRGGLTNHHKGNKRFRDIVALHRPDYVRAAKIHKPGVARLIVRAIRNSDPPGRFLKKDFKSNKFYDIGDKRAAEKASQALREKTPEERVQLKSDGPVVAGLMTDGDFTGNGEYREPETEEEGAMMKLQDVSTIVEDYTVNVEDDAAEAGNGPGRADEEETEDEDEPPTKKSKKEEEEASTSEHGVTSV